MAAPGEFYDGLAAGYHLLFDDWWTAAQDHGRMVAALLAARGVVPPASVLVWRNRYGSLHPKPPPARK